MEEKVFRCPWCGDNLEKGKFYGSSYAFVKDGEECRFPVPLKALAEDKSGIYIRNWTESPVAYACRTCRKIIHPY